MVYSRCKKREIASQSFFFFVIATAQQCTNFLTILLKIQCGRHTCCKVHTGLCSPCGVVFDDKLSKKCWKEEDFYSKKKTDSFCWCFSFQRKYPSLHLAGRFSCSQSLILRLRMWGFSNVLLHFGSPIHSLFIQSFMTSIIVDSRISVKIGDIPFLPYHGVLR